MKRPESLKSRTRTPSTSSRKGYVAYRTLAPLYACLTGAFLFFGMLYFRPLAVLSKWGYGTGLVPLTVFLSTVVPFGLDKLINARVYARLREQGWTGVKISEHFDRFSGRAWSRLPCYDEVAVIPWTSGWYPDEMLQALPMNIATPEGQLWAALWILDEQPLSGSLSAV